MDINTDTLTAIASIATPLLLLGLGGIGWLARTSIEATRKQEERWHKREEILRENRMQIYLAVLEPIIILLSKEENNVAQATELTMSSQYRRVSFQLMLIGSENVVTAYNEMMQGFFQPKKEQSAHRTLSLIGKFLLEIRKSVGSEDTRLTPIEMLEFMITDIRETTSK